MECFLPGAGSTGFWAVLEPVFGAGAFATGGHRLEHWLDPRTPEAMSFFLAWMYCQAEVRDTDVRGPLDDEPRHAGIASQGQLQHAITVQREQVEHQRLSDLLEGLPHTHPARSSWLEVGEFAQTLITSWPSENTGVALGFDDCLCHYLGGLIPSEVGKAGLSIPDSQPAGGARRPRRRRRRPGTAARADLRRLRAAAGDGVPAWRPH